MCKIGLTEANSQYIFRPGFVNSPFRFVQEDCKVVGFGDHAKKQGRHFDRSVAQGEISPSREGGFSPFSARVRFLALLEMTFRLLKVN